MPSISAVDAISPAIRRTRTFLFNPFRWRTYFKLCLVAVLTEGFGSRFNFSWPGGHSSPHSSGTQYAFYSLHRVTPAWIAVIVVAAVLFTLVSFFLVYLITRLRFAYFHCLIHNIQQIRPGWRLYRAPATRFFWLNVVVGLCFLLLMALIATPFVLGFWHLFRNNAHPDIGQVLALALPLIPLVLIFVFVGIAVDLILRDWMLPHYALDNSRAREAWAAVWTRIRSEKAPFFVYALLRVILPFVAAIAIVISLVILGLILAAAVALLALVIHSALTGITGGPLLAGRLLLVLLIAAAFFAVMLLLVGVFGPLSTAVRQYALIFYGARYQRLGEILYPPPPAPELNAEGTV